MKVKELIESLKTQNPESLVVVSGYEGGYAEVDKLLLLNVVLNCNKEWYMGKHESVEDVSPVELENYHQQGRVVSAIFLRSN